MRHRIYIKLAFSVKEILKKYNIGIIGRGFVGKAVAHGFLMQPDIILNLHL